MTQLNLKQVLKAVPSAADFGLSCVMVMNSKDVRIVSEYELPSELVEAIEAIAEKHLH